MKPKSLKIGAHNYQVRYEKEIENCWGRVIQEKQQILMSEKMQPSHKAETFLHEAIHVVASDRNLDLEEHEVDQLAAGLMAAIRDNEKIFGKHFVELWE